MRKGSTLNEGYTFELRISISEYLTQHLKLMSHCHRKRGRENGRYYYILALSFYRALHSTPARKDHYYYDHTPGADNPNSRPSEP